MSKRNLHRIAIGITLLLAAGIALGTLTAPENLPPEPPGSDKLHHFLAFAALAFPLVAARPRNALWMLPLVILYGGLIEVIQPSFDRSAEWGDFIADTLGATAGAAMGWWVHRRHLRHRLRDG